MDKSIFLKDLSKPENLQQLITYLQEAFRDLDIIYTETAPNGSLNARRGATALYNNSGIYTTWVNVNGETAWQQVDDAGANLALSNLASVAINTSLIPASNNAIDLGSDAKKFRTIWIDGVAYIDSLKLASGVVVVEIENNDSLGTSDVKLCTQGNTKAYADSIAGLTRVSQGDLNTATGEVSQQGSASTAGWGSGVKILPGGAYGFHPQTKIGGNSSGGWASLSHYNETTKSVTVTSYATHIRLGAYSDAGGGGWMYARQRYITASGHDHWIFLLVGKKDIIIEGNIIQKKGDIISSYQAPDHPSANQGGATEIDIPHPFGRYDSVKREIVIVDNVNLAEMYQRVTSRKSLLTVINEDFFVDDSKRPIWTPREIIKIDEYGDLEGEIIKTLKTPEWAKIVIGAPDITLKKKIVETLPSNILLKKMILKGGNNA